MRIITDSDGRVLDVSFGALISCGGQDGTDYTGTVPTGYTSLEDWFIKEADKLYRWTVVDGELTLDSSAVAPTDKLPAADYVVEQGTSGIWTYEKWNSGILKCYGKEVKTLTSASSAWQGGYSCGTQMIDVPFMLSAIYGNATAQHANVAYMANVVATGSKLYYVPLFDDPNATRNTTIQYYVVGKWK